MRLHSLLFLCLCTGIPTLITAETRHIHVIQMLDDNSPTYLIREGCRSIDYGVQREVDRMQRALGISDVHYYRLNGLNFTGEALDFVIDYQLAYQERDIVIFVYAGHGFRDAGSSKPLPKLYFQGYDTAQEGDDIRIRLLEKNPSVLINIIVACNAIQRDHRIAPTQPEDHGQGGQRLSAQARSTRPYHLLFSDQPGFTKVIDLVSSEREYETFMSRDGGIFFSEVLYALEEVFSEELLTSWPTICEYIENQTLIRTQERGLRQKPYCAYNVFRSLDDGTITITTTEYTSGPVNCRLATRQLRKQQKGELRQLRRRHRQESSRLPSRDQRRLTVARQRQEVSTMKYVHLQDYQRQAGSCK